MSIEEGEVWDAQRIYEEFYEKGIYELSASRVKEIYDGIDEAIKRLERDIREDQKSDSFLVQINIPRRKEELEDLKKKRKILFKRLQFFREKRQELGDIDGKVRDLRQCSKQVWNELTVVLDKLKSLIQRYQALQIEYGKLKGTFEQVTEDPSKWKEFPPSVELGSDIRDFVKKFISEITLH